ncbi:PLP-dependent aminotransferase family protein [Pseudomonas sp. 14P_8.1_Bac3]|uniref:MocR-like pyridoxine biosynthesis transcription factor PdxR n=1 Tax=Pseudomonas sp. 14P_8.1_Bac3 TaxID=2971621 RepID=UPI0021C75795|nr:PLP-dependent aminotransferase family protein [Pseudomonas sp. 14P_8.1_Bac3]MCU1763072.1 PLP-dependent aminotransferase family protein [Pseudomonas sp. 14P_8.1_Bac3]
MTLQIKNFSPLDPSATEPIYRQIYWRFRGAISDGLLAPGERIPAARALAKELGLARGTIDTAYSLLTAEGYLLSRGQAGTVVAPGINVRKPSATTEQAFNPAASTSIRHKAPVLPFQMALPALDAFPRKIWSQIGARCVRATRIPDMANPSVLGLESLRTAIATYLQVARGITCSPAQVFITAGYRNTLALIAHTLLRPGDRVLVEDPGYLPTRQLLAHLQIEVAPVPVDQDGMQVAYGVNSAADARAAVVTPAHQSPLCVSLSLPRRLELLEWATRQQAWIVEDDYDGEYRYVSRPLPALKSLDRDGRVLYAGTFSKVLFPGIRLSYLVVPAAQVERFEHVSETFLGGCPELTQAIVATFLTEGHFARHIQRMRKLYGERREATARGLKKALGDRIRIDLQPGGMHLILRLTEPQSDRALVQRLLAAGIYAEALTDWQVRDETDSALLLGFANIDSADTAQRLGERILALM